MSGKRSNRRKPTLAATTVTPARGHWIAGGIVTLAIVAVVWLWQAEPGGSRVDVVVPELSPVAEAGQQAFEVNCAACHGPTAGGTDQGPPLVHKWYEPSHHGDAAFLLATKRDVAQHHWRFGNMPPQLQVGERSVQQITTYVRELQRANGIE